MERLARPICSDSSHTAPVTLTRSRAANSAPRSCLVTTSSWSLPFAYLFAPGAVSGLKARRPRCKVAELGAFDAVSSQRTMDEVIRTKAHTCSRLETSTRDRNAPVFFTVDRRIDTGTVSEHWLPDVELFVQRKGLLLLGPELSRFSMHALDQMPAWLSRR